jgi:hypothetical protein
MLAAVAATAVDYLVTDDGRLRARARRAGLAENVLPLAEAVQLLRDLSPRPLSPPPAVEQVLSYQLDPRDPIFESLRDDYPDFDSWFAGVRKEHRPAWIIRDDDGNYAGGFCIHQRPGGRREPSRRSARQRVRLPAAPRPRGRQPPRRACSTAVPPPRACGRHPSPAAPPPRVGRSRRPCWGLAPEGRYLCDGSATSSLPGCLASRARLPQPMEHHAWSRRRARKNMPHPGARQRRSRCRSAPVMSRSVSRARTSATPPP